MNFPKDARVPPPNRSDLSVSQKRYPSLSKGDSFGSKVSSQQASRYGNVWARLVAGLLVLEKADAAHNPFC